MKASKNEILKAQWKNIIKDQIKSYLSIREWCKENNIAHGKFYYWKRVIREETLIDWEIKFKDLSPEDRKKQRLEKEKLVLEAFW